MPNASTQRRLRSGALLLAALACAWVGSTTARSSSSERPIAVLELEGAIHPASLGYLERGFREAEAMNAALIVLELDTPGGLLVSLREMTTAITTSSIPVAVYVAPPGARAASAGILLLMASSRSRSIRSIRSCTPRR